MKKLRCKKGVTITEMLCVLLVLALIGVTLVTGVDFAMKTYSKTLARSEARILCSTISAALKNELRYAGAMELKGTDFSYFSQSNGDKTRLEVSDDGIIQLVSASKTKDLVSASAYTYGAKAELTVTYDQTKNIFTVDLKIIGQNTTLAAGNFEVERLKESD